MNRVNENERTPYCVDNEQLEPHKHWHFLPSLFAFMLGFVSLNILKHGADDWSWHGQNETIMTDNLFRRGWISYISNVEGMIIISSSYWLWLTKIACMLIVSHAPECWLLSSVIVSFVIILTASTSGLAGERLPCYDFYPTAARWKHEHNIGISSDMESRSSTRRHFSPLKYLLLLNFSAGRENSWLILAA